MQQKKGDRIRIVIILFATKKKRKKWPKIDRGHWKLDAPLINIRKRKFESIEINCEIWRLPNEVSSSLCVCVRLCSTNSRHVQIHGMQIGQSLGEGQLSSLYAHPFIRESNEGGNAYTPLWLLFSIFSMHTLWSDANRSGTNSLPL